jgi:hypothetical protein
MKEGYYKVKTRDNVFEMSVVKYGSTYSIQFGDPRSREGPCSELSYDTRKPKDLLLENLAYYSRCAYGHDLKQGDGTRDMIYCVLKLCIDVFPEIKNVYFKDVSYFDCEEDDRMKVYLSYYDLLLYGQTWYERHFKAIAVDREDRQQIDKFRELLGSKPRKNVFPFYKGEKFDTWHEYFLEKKRHGCMFFCDNLPAFKHAAQIDLVYKDFKIRARDIREYEYEIRRSKKQSGGFSYGRGLQRLTEEDA